MVNTTSEHLKARKVFIFKHFRFHEHLKFYAQLSLAQKKFYNRGANSFAQKDDCKTRKDVCKKATQK